jgi:hypothetical protein
MLTNFSRSDRRTLIRSRGDHLVRLRVGTAATLFLLAACGQAPVAFGTTPETGRANAEEMLGAFATRFTQARRLGSLDNTHNQMVRNALFPSRLFEDTTLWSTQRQGDTHILSVYGTMVGAQYHLSAQPAAQTPSRAGDIRVVTTLSRLAESEYRWGATADLAIGTLSSADFFRGVRASLAELETRSERATRVEYQASLPRTAAALGVLFTLDTIRSVRRDDGSAVHFAAVTIHPDRARKTYPTFGKFLDDYVSPSRYRLTLVDRSGGTWLAVNADENLMTIRARTRNGELLPIDGPARALPDSLVLRADLLLHVLFFDIGMTDLIADVQAIRDEHEGGFAIRFRHEPKWHFPLATNRLIKTPLRRPFADEGSLFRLTVRDSGGAQTVISRRVATTFQESAILRWLARLNRSAADDYTEKADLERNRFLVDVFGALRSDVSTPHATAVKSDGGY